MSNKKSKNEVVKTHYNLDEYFLVIDEKFPSLSRWTIICLEVHLGIFRFHAGTQPLYQASDLEKMIEWLEFAKKEGRLIESNGFLVAPEFSS